MFRVILSGSLSDNAIQSKKESSNKNPNRQWKKHYQKALIKKGGKIYFKKMSRIFYCDGGKIIQKAFFWYSAEKHTRTTDVSAILHIPLHFND